MCQQTLEVVSKMAKVSILTTAKVVAPGIVGLRMHRHTASIQQQHGKMGAPSQEIAAQRQVGVIPRQSCPH